MATNPMQKKARNSFILGVLVTLIICLLIGVLLYLLILNPSNKANENGSIVVVYALAKDVKAGDQITSDSLTQIKTYSNMVPSNFIDSTTLSEYYSKQENPQQAPIVATIDMGKNTILTNSSVTKTEITDDVRYVEYNMLSLATNVNIGDYVDIRLTFPNGQDLIVVSKKRIENITGTAVGFEMTEGEIEMMESAIVESYIMTASKIYVSQYVAPTQTAATKTYVPTQAVKSLIEGNPNIQTEARTALVSKFNDGIRAWEDNARSVYEETEQENIETGITQEIENARKAREDYLSSLNAVPVQQ